MFQKNVVTLHAQSAKVFFLYTPARKGKQSEWKIKIQKDMNDRGEIVIYQTQDGLAKLDVILEGETVWITQDQMTELFQRDKSTISRHIKNIFEDGELEEKSVVAFFATTASDGKTYQVAYYNLDVIISVGYRVKSKREYPIVNTLRSQLNWSQYRSLIQIPNPNTPRYDSI